MEEAHEEGRDHDAGGGDEHDAGEEGVGGGEELGAVSVEFSGGTHASQDHGGVVEGVDPWEVGEVVVAEGTDGEGGQDHEARGAEGTEQPKAEDAMRDGLPWMLGVVHGASMVVGGGLGGGTRRGWPGLG